MQAKGLILQAIKDEKLIVQLQKRSNSMVTEIVADEDDVEEIK
jgi:hypothetical protein